jgi:hypothetical protein
MCTKNVLAQPGVARSPATWETKVLRITQTKVSNKLQYLHLKISQPWWHITIIPVIWERIDRKIVVLR